ncbi:cytochrome-c peroxidase [Flavihumibacter profundi]|jgi:cytochrome c peroxidase|uniref:cytochrome-c peroxidase n=1 Tax=Flavihumibacter profundi TaxID=2716883 RepID=UPI001CC5CCAA|nr:cytochrome c peroxidase [Flavihumibacter profundi]MBZ5858493.1 cytochrome-c peroxidase [Flavihumibacter profundi]
MRVRTIIVSLVWGILSGSFLLSCKKTDTVGKSPVPLSFPKPAGWPDTKYDFSQNPLTREGFELGRKLFFDGRLSKDGNFPCASCHQPFAAFSTYEHDLSHGFNNQFTTRNATALFNLAWQTEMHHDGGIANLDLQPLAPITAPNEMAETIPSVLEKLSADPDYVQQFKVVFGSPEITTARMTKALSQYMLMLVSASSKYDRVKAGKDVFTENEAAGYAIFLKKNCNSCHAEPLFTDLSYRDDGLPLNSSLNDVGRMRITGKKEDSLKFRVPSLRNILLTKPYMHDGRMVSLDAVYDHYSKKNPLSSVERGLLTEFFRSLTDSSLVENPALADPN